MPVLRQHLAIAARGLSAFLNLEAGVTRADAGAAPAPPQQARGQQEQRTADQNGELEEARRLLASKDRELAELRERLITSGTGTGVGGVNPENVVWIFGSGRSGSTWLSSMMGDIEGHALWGEPWVGTLFGNFYHSVDERKHKAPQFIMGRRRETWLGSIRNFVLDGARANFPALGEDGYLIIKEPNGSIGAPLLMEALPESRMTLLVRDPRDIVASAMDARSEGGWNYERNKSMYLDWRRVPANKDPDAFVEGRAKNFLAGMGKAKEAYDAHRGRKVLIKYEELRADALGTMKRMYSTLGVPVDEEELARVVEKHSWENIPEEITAPLLKDFYPHEGQSENPPRSRR